MNPRTIIAHLCASITSDASIAAYVSDRCGVKFQPGDVRSIRKGN